MGLAASQARLLSLTSRMSDLELRAQILQNAKTRLSYEGNDASEAYSKALDRQTLQVFSGLDANNTKSYDDATAYNLTTYNPNSLISDKQRLIKDSYGRLIVNPEVANAYEASKANSYNFETFMNNISVPGENGKYYTSIPANDDATIEPPAPTLSDAAQGLFDNLSSNIGAAAVGTTPGSGVLGDITVTPGVTTNTYANPDTTTAFATAQSYIDAAKAAVSAPDVLTSNQIAYNLIQLQSVLGAGMIGARNTRGYTDAQISALAATANCVENPKSLASAANLSAQRSNSQGLTFETRYEDTAIRAAVFNDDGADRDHVTLFKNQEWSDTGDNSAILGALSTTVAGVCSSASTALTSNLSSRFGDNWPAVEPIITSATSTATTKTQSFYASTITSRASVWKYSDNPRDHDDMYNDYVSCHNDNWTEWHLFYGNEGYDGARTKAKNHNYVTMGWNGTDDWFVDQNKILATFLNYFDEECARYANINDPTTKANFINQYETANAGNSDRPLGHGGTNAASKNEIISKSNDDQNCNGLKDTYEETIKSAIDGIGLSGLEALFKTNSTTSPATYAAKQGVTQESLKGRIQIIDDTLDSIGALDSDVAVSAYTQALAPILNSLSGTSAPTSAQMADIVTALNSITAGTAALKSQAVVGSPGNGSGSTTLVYDSEAKSYYLNIFNQLYKDGRYNPQNLEDLKSSAWLQANIDNGTIFLWTDENTDGTFENVSWGSGDSTLHEETDATNTAKAEAEYKLTMSRIETKEKTMDNQLKQIDTEHSATQTEIESIKKIIDKNIDRTLKVFDA